MSEPYYMRYMAVRDKFVQCVENYVKLESKLHEIKDIADKSIVSHTHAFSALHQIKRLSA